MASISQVEEFWNRRPCNINHSSKEFLSKEYFDEVEAKKYLIEPHIPKFAEFGKYKGKKVLEIGCGIGTDSINFARHGAILTIVELSEKSLNITKERFRVFGLEATFILGNVEDLSVFLPEQNFDLIYSFGVIHHTPNQDRAFEQISKYMGPTTELKLMVYSKVSFKLFWLLMESNAKTMGNFENIIRTGSEAQTNCPVTYTYTMDEISELLMSKGIHVQSIWKDHIFSWSIEQYKRGEYVKDNYWKDTNLITFKKLEKELGWHTMVVAKKVNFN